jgi:hypothetical protein
LHYVGSVHKPPKIEIIKWFTSELTLLFMYSWSELSSGRPYPFTLSEEKVSSN